MRRPNKVVGANLARWAGSFHSSLDVQVAAFTESMLTKEQWEKLSPEQQQALAAVELRSLDKRQRLLRQARGYTGRWLLSVVLLLYMPALLLLGAKTQQLVAFALLGLFALVQFHVTGINRRLNALMELLERDRSDGTGTKSPQVRPPGPAVDHGLDD